METALRATQSAATRSDHELVLAVRRGDDRAFEELYSRYRSRIGSYVFGMVGDYARSEDIAQEVFISALRRLRDTERPIAFKPWLYEIAKNACIDEFRRARRKHEVPLGGEGDDDEAGPVRMELAGGATPDAAVENKQRIEDLRGAFRGLSESHHKIIVMREFEGLTYDQIGEQLGISKAMVESTLFRARKRLGEEYEELVSGRRCEQIQGVIAGGERRPLRALGLRDRRQLARHLSHCQPCRRCARMAGVDESFFHTPGVIGKIAALLPFPAWRWRWRRSHNADDAGGAVATHQFAALQALQGIARFGDFAGSSHGLGRATATAAAIVIAGAGGGIVGGLGTHGNQLGSIERALLPPHRAAPTAAAIAPAALKSARSPSTGVTPSPAAQGSSSSTSPRTGAAKHPTATVTKSGGTTAGGSSGNPLGGAGSTAGSVLQQAQGTASSTVGKVAGAVNGVTSTTGKVVNGATGSNTPTVPGVTVPPLPSNPLPPVPTPPLPTVSTTTTPQIPTVPGVTVPNPTSLIPPLGQKHP